MVWQMALCAAGEIMPASWGDLLGARKLLGEHLRTRNLPRHRGGGHGLTRGEGSPGNESILCQSTSFT